MAGSKRKARNLSLPCLTLPTDPITQSSNSSLLSFHSSFILGQSSSLVPPSFHTIPSFFNNIYRTILPFLVHFPNLSLQTFSLTPTNTYYSSFPPSTLTLTNLPSLLFSKSFFLLQIYILNQYSSASLRPYTTSPHIHLHDR